MHTLPLWSVAAALAVAAVAATAGEGTARARSAEKPRVMVMTDIGGDPDDMQSMVRFLLYTCDFEVEGLLTGFGHGHYKRTRPDLIRERVEAYGKVVDNLRKHRGDYPSKDRLLALIKDGHNGDPHMVGKGMDSEASAWIISVLDRDDPRPVWFTIWGGPRELAQAIWKVQSTRTPKELAAFKRKIRVHSIADQDRTARWVKQNHPDVFWIYSRCFRGIWWGYDAAVVSPRWLETHVRTGHGPLGPLYPAKAAGKAGVKEGDTPSFFYVLPNGLGDPGHPEWGGWGGRFRPSGKGAEWVDAADRREGRSDPRWTIARWRRAYQNDFEARMDWCVKPLKEANHEPMAVCSGDKGRRVLQIEADPDTQVKLSAAGSSDPDGDKLTCTWWVYEEAGSYWGDVPIRGADALEAVVTVPRDAAGRTIHVVLEVVDDGVPPLTAYRRVVVKVSGEPVGGPRGFAPSPVGGGPGWGRRRWQWTARSGALPPAPSRGEGEQEPPAKAGPWTFYRGINLNGPPIEIDGHKWEGDKAPNFACKDRQVNSPRVRLVPPCDAARAKMIHAFRWNRRASITLSGVPKGKYAVYAYVWEDNNPETFTIRLEGRDVARDYYSGQEGEWRRLGPWMATIADGTIRVTSRGGAANFSGIEAWRAASDADR